MEKNSEQTEKATYVSVVRKAVSRSLDATVEEMKESWDPTGLG